MNDVRLSSGSLKTQKAGLTRLDNAADTFSQAFHRTSKN